MRRNLILLLFSCAFFESALAQAQTSPALSPAWLKLYQYKKTSRGYFSNNVVQGFFFSSDGAFNPEAEMKAAAYAFESEPELACKFPARFEVLKKLLNKNWNSPKCDDLMSWLSRLDADSVSIVFASAYTGNPASLLGHTFLRFYNRQKEQYQESFGLLSYAVGFLALPEKQYGQIRYFYKGLTGGFVGGYDMEPFYIKVGLYNNSESRDLYEQPLNFSKDEVLFFQKYLWEMTFFGGFPYYFLDENCSYRILTALEAVRPSLNLESKNSLFVLPAETVRELVDMGVADPNERFRSSIRRRVATQLSDMTPQQKTQVREARTNPAAIAPISDIQVLDVLIDEWKYRNYRAKTLLEPKQAEQMRLTLERRAQIPEASDRVLTDTEIANRYSLIPPYKSHRPSAIALGAGYQNANGTSQDELILSAYGQLGAHNRWQNPGGYFDHSEIEYFSFSADFGVKTEKLSNWNLNIAHVKAIEPLSSLEKNWSWQFTLGFANDCDFCGSAGAGGAFQIGSWSMYIMPLADLNHGVGYDFGLKKISTKNLFNFSLAELHKRKEFTRTFTFEGRHLKKTWPLFSFKNENSSTGEFRSRLSLSYPFD